MWAILRVWLLSVPVDLVFDSLEYGQLEREAIRREDSVKRIW